MSKYDIIYADPPWGQYKDKAKSGERGASFKYPLMSLEEISHLQVNKLANDDAFLFLWITMPLLFDAQKVIESWGFKYKTIGFVWIKTYPKASKVLKSINKNIGMISMSDFLKYLKETIFIGMGNFTRSNCELCLLATRGSPKRVSASISSVVISPIQKHSEKPQEVRNRIVQLCGEDKKRLELFARSQDDKWDLMGNHVSNLDIGEEINEYIKTIK